MNINKRRSPSSTIAISVVVLISFITLLQGIWSPVSFAASSAGVSPSPPPAGTFNVQVQALKVTQGVRGDIPSRTAPGDGLVLVADGAVHVANRRTVVRAYPWVEVGPEATAPPLTARLWAYRDGEPLPGSPIMPVNPRLESITPGWTMEEMRGDAYKSWNFLLPQAWVTLASWEESFDLRFVVEANPPGANYWPECEGCDDDNTVILNGQEFTYVPRLILKPYFVDHTITIDEDKGINITFPGPTRDEFHAALRTVHSLLPIGDGAWGMVILPQTRVAWHGPLKEGDERVFAEAMIERYFPGGSLETSQPGVYHLFLFSPSTYHETMVGRSERGSLGMAWVGRPYVQAPTRGPTLVHELTHAIGLSHAGNRNGEADGGGFNADYPDARGRVEPNAYGFDLWSMRAIPPDGGREGTFDYMSYGPDSHWVSIYTWENAARLLGQPNLGVTANLPAPRNRYTTFPRP